jgi:hypothetical protein
MVPSEMQWQWNGLLQSTYGHESNLNSATYTDSLTLYLSNGPVTLGLTDNAKPVSGSAYKTNAALQGSLRGLGGQELSVNMALASKTGAASVNGNNRTAEGALKYSLPMLAGNASGVWQVRAGHSFGWATKRLIKTKDCNLSTHGILWALVANGRLRLGVLTNNFRNLKVSMACIPMHALIGLATVTKTKKRMWR